MTYDVGTTIPLHAYFLDEDGEKIAVAGTTGDTLDGSGADGTEILATITLISTKPAGGYSPVTGWDETPMLLADTSDTTGPLAKEYFIPEDTGTYEAVYELTKGDLVMRAVEKFEVADLTIS
jgi:hypothetical protein